MIDARNLVPLSQKMVDEIIPLAEAFEESGDFTISLHVKRRGGKAVVDVNVSSRRSR